MNPYDSFKAYDIRGELETQLTPDFAEQVGRAFTQYLGAKSVVVGGDIRLSTPELKAAFARGCQALGAEVIDIGDGALRWADSHCHVYDERIPDGSSAALDLARADGVDTFIVVGCDRATTRSALEIAAAHRDAWATVGLHPHEASHGVESVVDLLDAPGVVEAGFAHHSA